MVESLMVSAHTRSLDKEEADLIRMLFKRRGIKGVLIRYLESKGKVSIFFDKIPCLPMRLKAGKVWRDFDRFVFNYGNFKIKTKEEIKQYVFGDVCNLEALLNEEASND